MTAGDVSDTDLACTLADLSAAGLMGIYTEILRVELNGTSVPRARTVDPAGRTHRLRPAVDQRILLAARDFRRALDSLNAALGIRDADKGGDMSQPGA